MKKIISTLGCRSSNPNSLDFYHLNYLNKNRSQTLTRRLSRQSSQKSAVSRLGAPARQTSGKLNLALVEDPLLAQAAANNIQRPPTPPEGQDSVLELPDFKGPELQYEQYDGEIQDKEDPAQEQETWSTEPNLVVHAKVYAIAEK